MPDITATCEIEADDDEGRVIRTHEVLIEFTCSLRVAATYWQPAEGGELEFIGADVLGNNGRNRWVKLRPCDPLYQWAESYFDANPDECVAEARRAERDEADERGDREYDRRRDDQRAGDLPW